MDAVNAPSSLTMASLYAMMGLAMPASGSTGVAASPALAMLSAANASQSAEIGALVGGAGAASSGSGSTDWMAALLSLSTLNPAVELGRIEGAVPPTALASPDQTA